MSGEGAAAFPTYSLGEVLAALWRDYHWTLVLIGVWLSSTTLVLWRQRHFRPRVLLRGTTSGPDLWTLPLMLVCFQAVTRLVVFMQRCGVDSNAQADLAATWLVSAAGFAAVVVSLAVSTLAAFIGRALLGDGLSVVPRVGLPGVVALLSTTLLWLLFLYMVSIYGAA